MDLSFGRKDPLVEPEGGGGSREPGLAAEVLRNGTDEQWRLGPYLSKKGKKRKKEGEQNELLQTFLPDLELTHDTKDVFELCALEEERSEHRYCLTPGATVAYVPHSKTFLDWMKCEFHHFINTAREPGQLWKKAHTSPSRLIFGFQIGKVKSLKMPQKIIRKQKTCTP